MKIVVTEELIGHTTKKTIEVDNAELAQVFSHFAAISEMTKKMSATALALLMEKVVKAVGK